MDEQFGTTGVAVETPSGETPGAEEERPEETTGATAETRPLEIAREAAVKAKAAVEKAVEVGTPLAREAAVKAKEAVEKAVEVGTPLAREAAVKAKEAVESAVDRGREMVATRRGAAPETPPSETSAPPTTEATAAPLESEAGMGGPAGEQPA